MPISSFLAWPAPFSAVPKIFVIFPCIFLKKIIFHFLPRKNIFLRKRNPSFTMVQERSHSGAIFLKRLSFQNIWKKYHISMCFFEKDHLSFSVLRIRSYFRGKEISSFLMMQEISCSGAIFLKRSSFQNIWKKKMWFFVQWKIHQYSHVYWNQMVSFYHVHLSVIQSYDHLLHILYGVISGVFSIFIYLLNPIVHGVGGGGKFNPPPLADFF